MSSATSLASLLVTILCIVQSSSEQCFTNLTLNRINERQVEDDVKTLIQGSLEFSFKLLEKLTGNQPFNGNRDGIFFSPYSVWSALIVTLVGARGKSELELRRVLGTNQKTSKEDIWGAFHNIHAPERDLSPSPNRYTLANRVYFQSGTQIRNCVKQMIGSDIGFTDFAQNPIGSSKEINDWVSGQTNGKIRDLIPPDAIDQLTNMVIANAVYFKENWKTQFDPAHTKRRRFTLENRSDIFVKMMNLRGRFHYAISEELQCTALELPYSEGSVSMLILLPHNKFHGFRTLANKLTPEKLNNLLMDMYPREVVVSLPKFKLEDTFEMSLILNKMGLRTIFDPNQADLSDFTGSKEFTVDAVHHKSFIEVNEEGTEAAAATAIISSRSARPLAPAAFIADYPFIFMIRDTMAEVIFFMGIVQKPPEFHE